MLPPHEEPTVTGAGQIGIAFSRHERVSYAVGGRCRQASYDGGAVVLSGGEPIVWSDVRDPTEAVEIVPDPVLLGDLAGGPAMDLGRVVGEAVIGGRDPVGARRGIATAPGARHRRRG